MRVVHYAPLDVYDDRGLRVLQVITSLHRGGAERMTLDLMAELPACNVRARLATLGRPLREAFAAPAGTLDLAGPLANPEARAAALARLAIAFGADLVHGHLITGSDVRRIAAAGLPVMLTVHNTRPGWPEGLADLGAAGCRPAGGLRAGRRSGIARGENPGPHSHGLEWHQPA